ncbi:MAG: zinc-ribbon domain-containing protein [Halanaeroarchaeum sp.]
MSKITVRADDDLVDAIEEMDASKSDVMREALRSYLGVDGAGSDAIGRTPAGESLEDVVSRRVDAILSDRLSERATDDAAVTVSVNVRGTRPENVSVEGPGGRRHDDTWSDAQASDASDAPDGASAHRTRDDRTGRCSQCGNDLEPDHAFCPNCGTRNEPSFYCECGRDLEPDWSFCPSCGRRTATPDLPEP